MATPSHPTQYARLGGVYSIAAVVDDLINRVTDDPCLNADPRIDEAHPHLPELVLSGRNRGSLAVASAGGDAQLWCKRAGRRSDPKRLKVKPEKMEGGGDADCCGCTGHFPLSVDPRTCHAHRARQQHRSRKAVRANVRRPHGANAS
jgi:hypothetical protein